MRFEYSSDDGLPATFNARPYVGFTALEQTRLGEDLPDVATEYENAAVASGNGDTGHGTPVISTRTSMSILVRLSCFPAVLDRLIL